MNSEAKITNVINRPGKTPNYDYVMNNGKASTTPARERDLKLRSQGRRLIAR